MKFKVIDNIDDNDNDIDDNDDVGDDEVEGDLLLLLHLLPEALLVGEGVWQGVAVAHLAQSDIRDTCMWIQYDDFFGLLIPVRWLQLRRFRITLAGQTSTQAAKKHQLLFQRSTEGGREDEEEGMGAGV